MSSIDFISSRRRHTKSIRCKKLHNPINQIVGYLISGDPAYIPRYKDARNLIRKIERDEVIEELVKFYLSELQKVNK